ncbi:MAG TPA: hypothetical protein VFW21_00240 [Mycobacterium sp.]|nr:hypothetical protein [Mycobacterium sp.]
MTPADEALPALSSIAVRPASIVTDVLTNLGVAVNAGVWAVETTGYAIGYLPYYAIAATVAAAQDPSHTANVLSYVLQQYLNPAFYTVYTPSDPATPATYYDSYPLTIAYGPLWSIAALLPIGSDQALAAIDDTATKIGTLFSGLPDPVAGQAAMWKAWGTVTANAAGQLVDATTEVLPSVVNALGDVVSWAGYQPALLEASVESALRDPSQIPGLLSNLVVYAAQALVYVADDLATPLQHLPAPIGDSGSVGGWATTAVNNFVTGLNQLLSHLPAYVTPTPFAAVSATTPAASTTATSQVSSVPSPAAATFTLTAATATEATDKATAPRSDAPAPKEVRDLKDVKGVKDVQDSTKQSVTDTPDTPSAPTDPTAPVSDADGTAKADLGKDKGKGRLNVGSRADKSSGAAGLRRANTGDGGSASATGPRHAKAGGSSAPARHGSATKAGAGAS